MPISPPPPEVEVLVVYAPRLPALGGEAVFAVQQIDAAELKTAPRLDVALKRAPGVSLFRRTGSDAANPTIQGISLRGVAPSGAGRALVTLDGAPQNDSFGGWVIWSALPPEGLESVTIVRGAGAGAYGAGALTGVIALQERGATNGISALDVSLAQRGGARAAVAMGTTGLLLTASAETSDGYVPVRRGRGAADTPTTLDAESFAVRVQGEHDGMVGALRLGIYEEQRGAGLAGANSTASGGSITATVARIINGGGWRLQAWARSSELANTSSAVAAGRVATTPASDQYSTPALGYGFNAAWQGRGEVFSWEVGGDARFADGHAFERFRYLTGAFTRGRESGGATAVAGLYAEGVLDQGDWLVTGGARVDAWRQEDAVRRERDLATGAVTLNQTSPDTSGTTPTARFGVRYRLSEASWLRGAAYAGFRPPTLNELHRPFRVGNDVTEANPTLTPETLYGVEFGVGGDGETRWSGTIFYNRLDDPITNVTVGAGPATFPVAGFIPAGGVLRQRRNAGQIEAWGLEADIARSFGDLTLNGALAATKARVDGGSSAPQLTGKRPAQTPEYTVTAGADWRAGDHLTLSVDLRLESERFEDDLNSRKLAASVGIDARAAWRLTPDSEVYLAAQNLTDARIEVGETGDGTESFAAPRTFRIGFSLRR
ncbi:TonB-dependent receptor [Phenylobacterium sp. 20VBR1]|uniref:TonB-dependent receptor n=1 Tax=Phenylobacterium glaciei TaxID=2803784 RepID=A0A941CZ31_9CAUL|nr:TonB-dependent receptor [Phenylobacterium glaciei]MBR7619315.1 TonB-dependent receptor [Phenylobacterium glaciei]